MSTRPQAGRLLVSLSLAAALVAGAASRLAGLCGPFTDVAADAFCPFVLEIFYLGITAGTTATTYDPASGVTRLQMAAFLSRTVDGVLKRGGRRAAMGRFWTSQNATVLGLSTITHPLFCASDGLDVWVTSDAGVKRIRAADGRTLETWTSNDPPPSGVLTAMGHIVVGSSTSPGKLYLIDPSQSAGFVTTVATGLGSGSEGLAFDGARVWTVNPGTTVGDGSVSIVTPSAAPPWPATTVTTGFSNPIGIVFDGSNIWVTDETKGALLKLDGSAGILLTVTVGGNPLYPVFDGTSIWVPNLTSNSVTVVRASSGAVLQTLTGNGLNGPIQAAFDGEQVLVTNLAGGGPGSVSLWKAADLTSIGSVPTGSDSQPNGACSDGINFWITLEGGNKLARF